MIKDISYEVFKNLVIEFLNEQNILKLFEENLLKLKELSLNEYIFDFYQEYHSIDKFFLASFYWRNTKEDYCFWENINDNYFA